MIRIQLTTAIAAVLFVFMAGASLPPPTYDYDGCPPHTLEWCEKDRPKLCNSTTVCGVGEKCCPVSCNGMQCMPAGVKEREGICPNNIGSDSFCQTVVPSNDCSNDEQCLAGQKCCKKACGGLGCMGTVTVYPPAGTPICPVYDKKFDCKGKRSAYTCNPEEEKCSNGGKCCPRECSGTSCDVQLCPAPDHNIQCALAETKKCNSSSTCASGQVCCEIYCGGTRCMTPIGPNTGSVEGSSGSANPSGVQAVKGNPTPICPKPSKDLQCPDSLKKRACQSDAQCGSKKCCETGCNVNVCQTPVRPGTCPNIMAKCKPPTEADKKSQCGTDMSCPGSQKCCSNPCAGYGAICLDPVKPGTCPMTIQGCPAGQTISNKCTGDYDCTGNLKCCSAGCGRSCMAPVA